MSHSNPENLLWLFKMIKCRLKHGIHARVGWSCRNAPSHTVSYSSIKNGQLVSHFQNLNRHDGNIRRNEGEKEPIDVEPAELSWSWNDETAIGSRCSDAQEDEQILFAELHSKLQNQALKKLKKVTQWLFDDCGIGPNEKKIKKVFLEVISNTKILNLNFKMKLPTFKICQTHREDETKGTWQLRLWYYNLFNHFKTQIIVILYFQSLNY